MPQAELTYSVGNSHSLGSFCSLDTFKTENSGKVQWRPSGSDASCSLALMACRTADSVERTRPDPRQVGH